MMVRALLYVYFSEAGEISKPSKQEQRRANNAVKRQKMLEEERRQKEKVKHRLDLIRQMKGERRFCVSIWGIYR